MVKQISNSPIERWSCLSIYKYISESWKFITTSIEKEALISYL